MNKKIDKYLIASMQFAEEEAQNTAEEMKDNLEYVMEYFKQIANEWEDHPDIAQIKKTYKELEKNYKNFKKSYDKMDKLVW